MLDPIVQSALVILVAEGLKYLAALAGFPLDEETLNTIAVAIVAFLLAQFGLSGVKKLLPGAVRSGILKEEK